MARGNIKESIVPIIISLVILAGIVSVMYSVFKKPSVGSDSQPSSATDNTSNSSTNSSKYYATSDPAMYSASQLFSVIDGARIAGGIVALQEDPSLDGAANLRAYQIQQNGTSYQADSNSIFHRISTAVPATTYGYEVRQPICDGATTSSTYASLVGSDAVYQALNDPRFTFAGVGLIKSDPGKCDGFAVIELADIN